MQDTEASLWRQIEAEGADPRKTLINLSVLYDYAQENGDSRWVDALSWILRYQCLPEYRDKVISLPYFIYSDREFNLVTPAIYPGAYWPTGREQRFESVRSYLDELADKLRKYGPVAPISLPGAWAMIVDMGSDLITITPRTLISAFRKHGASTTFAQAVNILNQLEQRKCLQRVRRRFRVGDYPTYYRDTSHHVPYVVE